jgi:hypothetical protein
MMKNTVLSLSTLMLAASLLVAPALADTLNLSLATPVQKGGPGSTLTFDATVLAPLTNGATVYLNSDNFGLTIPGSTIDDSGFLFNFPFTLDPGDQFTDTLFTVTLPSYLVPGTYDGFFEIFGGSSGDAQDPLATVDFKVSAVPEPGTWLFLATGLGILATTLVRRRYLSHAQAAA